MITRENIDELVDNHKLQVRGWRTEKDGSPRWYDVRRNGRTRRWKRDKARIYLPLKVGLRETFAITESDFGADGLLADNFRIRPL